MSSCPIGRDNLLVLKIQRLGDNVVLSDRKGQHLCADIIARYKGVFFIKGTSYGKISGHISPLQS